MDHIIENKFLALKLIENDDKSANRIIQILKERQNLNDEQINIIERKLNRIFIPTFMRKWKNSFYNKENFFKNNQSWLNSKFSIPPESAKCKESAEGKNIQKNFADCSDRTKKRRLQAFSEACNHEVHVMLTSDVRRSGQNENVTACTSTANYGGVKPISRELALGHVMNSKLSKLQYESMRELLEEHNVCVLPTYKKLTVAKNECYPEPSAITITETSATVELQALLNHTVERLFKVPGIFPSELEKCKNIKFHMITKWGCDGASGLSTYKQRFTQPTFSDESIFSVALVPLQITCTSYKQFVIWKNPTPGSMKFCRPIKFDFSKETPEKTMSEYNYIRNEIKNLEPTTLQIANCKVCVYHELQCTMVDGKVVHVISGTSSASVCCLCGSKPSEMNDLKRHREIKDVTALQFGLSTLHAWIRFMEGVLHIAYRLPFKKWTIQGENKSIAHSTKKRIQQEFREQLGLLVDVPKQRSGTTNDGNTARTFFSNVKATSKITGVDEQLIHRFHVILQTMASGEHIDAIKFETYAFETAELYVSKYPWYFMPASVHKVLLHGAKVIEALSLPLGFYTEESLEARNKIVKSVREHGTRKDS